ncbi:MAG: hypothetical protein D6693_05305 [Planctomycetota bacterium]|nr:MAG: hypothetical protein D6693_05305 [Planctomycetota bacterium]
MDDGATVTALRRTPDGWRRSTRTAAQFAEGIASAAASLKEIMRDPLVRVDGPLAVVWTPYDFFIDGRPSHSGTDAVVLILDRGAWKVRTIVYTAHPAEDSLR